MTTEEKALHFISALTDVYRDEEERELEAFSKLELSDDATDDLTAMLVALRIVLTGCATYYWVQRKKRSPV